MKALQLTASKQLDFIEVSSPEIAPDEVLVRVCACGICGSDVHGIDGSTGRRIPPIIMGHEAAGIIEKIGPQVIGWRVGDRVTFDSTVYCGDCGFCRDGDINLCDNRRVLGVSCGDYRRHGAFAEFINVPQRILYRLPENLTFEQAAMVEPVSIAFHAANRVPMKISDTAVVVGTGMIGLLVVQALRVVGCGKIIAVDIDPKKLDLACSLGADVGIRSDTADVAEEVKKLTDGRGADVAFEVVGINVTVNTAISTLRKGGSLALVGNLSPKTELPLQQVVTRELTLYGCCASSGEYKPALEMIARGSVKVEPFISAVAPLEQGADWFMRLYDAKEGLMKVILKP